MLEIYHQRNLKSYIILNTFAIYFLNLTTYSLKKMPAQYNTYPSKKSSYKIRNVTIVKIINGNI